MALSTFVQDNKIFADWVQQQVNVRSVAQAVVSVRRNVDADSVDFPVASAGTLQDYTVGQDLTLENVDGTVVTIPVATNKYMLRNIDNVVNDAAAQSIMTQVARDIGNKFATHIDTSVFTACFNAGTLTDATTGVTTTPVAVTTKAEAESYILACRNLFLANDLDLMDTFLVVPYQFGGLLAQASADSNRQGQNNQAFSSGFVNNVYGIDIFESDKVPADVAGGLAAGEFGVLGGHKGAGCLAIRYDKFETGSSMPKKDGEYIYQNMLTGQGANNAGLLLAGVITQ